MATSVIDDMNDPEFRKLLAQEELILEVTETLCEILRMRRFPGKNWPTVWENPKALSPNC